MIADYMHSAAVLPGLGGDIAQKLTELLKLFNTRTCQLVLGARAMQVAGLKTITAKHLALAAQSTALLSALVPHLAAALKALLPDRQQVLLVQLDALVGDLQAHESEIYLKLVSILKERLDYYCHGLADEAWNDACTQAASAYMRGLTKELQALVRVLSSTLPRRAVQKILVSIAHAGSKRLAEHYAKLPWSTSVSQHRVHQDVVYFTKVLQGFDDLVVGDDDLAPLHSFCAALPAFRDK
jgi:vacuolar protein sorting-associated protein 54